MREQGLGLTFIPALHCCRTRGRGNNFLTSSSSMQTFAANDMGCALVSCTAAFSFPDFFHAHSPKKASSEQRDETPRISQAGMQQCRQKTQLKRWTSPEQASDISLGHAVGTV